MFNKNLITLLKKLPAWLLLIVSLTGLFAAPIFAANEGSIVIKTASFSPQNGLLLLNADIRYTLSDEAIDALHNGVTLTFNVDLSTLEKRPRLWNKHLSNSVLIYRIKYHTLAETYQVSNTNTYSRHNFSSLTAALHALGNIKGQPLYALAPPNTYAHAVIKAYLSIEALPLPMRPMAYLTPNWYLRSNSFEWPLNP